MRKTLPWLYCLAQLSFAFFVFWTWAPKNIPVILKTEIDLIEPAADRAQIFWKSFEDPGYQEHESQRFGLQKGHNTIVLELLANQTAFIRFDPLLALGKANLSPLCFSYLQFELECWALPQQFESQKVDSQLEFRMGARAIQRLRILQWCFIFFATSFVTLFFVLLTWLISGRESVGSDTLKFKGNSIPKKAFVGIFVAVSVCGWIIYRMFAVPASSETVGFTHGKAPVFIEHLFDQKGRPLSDRPGNFAVMMDPFAMFRNFPNQKVFGVTTDRNGFRGSDSINNKHVGLILGGSAAFGWRLNGDPETLDAALNKTSDLHFINMATVSHLIGQELSILVHYGSQFKPRYVIGFSGWNDFFENYLGIVRSGFGYNSAFEEYQNRLRRLYEFEPRRNVKKPISDGLQHFGRVPPEELAKHYVSSALKIHQFCKAIGAEFILVIQPDLHFKSKHTANEAVGLNNWDLYIEQTGENFKDQYLQYAQKIETLSKANGISVLNLVSSPEFQNIQGELFSDTVHLSKEGNELAAKLIMEKYQISHY